MAQIGELVGQIKLDSTGFDKGIKSAQGGVAKTSGALDKLSKVAIAGVVGAFAGLGAAATAASASIAKDFVDLYGGVGDLETQLGLTREEAEALSDTALDVYANNFGKSIKDVNDSLVLTQRNMKHLDEGELQSVTEDALALRDAFGTDVRESTSAANQLMKNFGLTSGEAFDFITKGFQKGLDSSGDFVDSIGEYSTQFNELGAGADEFFSVMESGLGGGVLGTDKAADAMKEFVIRLTDGSKTTKEGLDSIGISSDELFKKISDGSMTPIQAFGEVQSALSEIEDPIKRNEAGVKLLGTQFEDLGAEAVLALDTSMTSMEDLAGASEDLGKQYNNLGDIVRGGYRKMVKAAKPLNDAVLDAAEKYLPKLEKGFDKLFSLVGGFDFAAVIDTDAFAEITTTIGGAMEELGELAEEAIPIISQVFRDHILKFLPILLKTVVPIMESLSRAFGNLVEFIRANMPAIGSILETVFGVARFYFEMISAVVTNVLLPVFDSIIQIVMRVAQIFMDNWESISLIIENAKVIIEGAIQAVIAVFNLLFPVVKFVANVIVTAFEFILPVVLAVTSKVIEVLAGLTKWLSVNIPKAINFLKGAWENILVPTFNYLREKYFEWVHPVVVAIIGWFQDRIPKAIQRLKTFWDTVLVPTFNFLREKYVQHVHPIVTAIADWFQTKIPRAIENLRSKWDIIVRIFGVLRDKYNQDVKPKVEAIIGFFKQKIPEAINALKGKWDEISGKFGELRGKYDSTVGPVLGQMESAFARVRDTVNDLIWRIQDLIGKIGSIPSLPDFGNIKIPGFATGTNFAPGGLAMVGERGPELVNLPRGSQVFDAQKTKGMMKGGAGMTLNITINGGSSDANSIANQVVQQVRRALARDNLSSSYGINPGL